MSLSYWYTPMSWAESTAGGPLSAFYPTPGDGAAEKSEADIEKHRL